VPAEPGSSGSHRLRALVVLLAVAVLGLAGCADPDGSGLGAAGTPGLDVDALVAPDPGLAALVPPDVRSRGVLRVGQSVSAPPVAFVLPDGRTVVGQDIDVVDAVGRVLGLRVERTQAAFVALLPGLGTGRFDVAAGNLSATAARERTVDMVTYGSDGEGFAVRSEDPSPPITTLDALCGHTVGVGAGSSFEATLDAHATTCGAGGREPWTVNAYVGSAALYLSLAQRRTDVLMNSTNGLRYVVARSPRYRIVGETGRVETALALGKSSPLTPAVHAAVQYLIDRGAEGRILAAWGTSDSAITTSRVDPP
jgi:polar amino acid transport system substrate-binding protein